MLVVRSLLCIHCGEFIVVVTAILKMLRGSFNVIVCCVVGGFMRRLNWSTLSALLCKVPELSQHRLRFESDP